MHHIRPPARGGWSLDTGWMWRQNAQDLQNTYECRWRVENRRSATIADRSRRSDPPPEVGNRRIGDGRRSAMTPPEVGSPMVATPPEETAEVGSRWSPIGDPPPSTVNSPKRQKTRRVWVFGMRFHGWWYRKKNDEKNFMLYFGFGTLYFFLKKNCPLFLPYLAQKNLEFFLQIFKKSFFLKKNVFI